jgi:hypothetical protein
MRIFGTNIDISFACPHSEAGNRHAFDQHEGIALHHHAVGKSRAIAFVGIADDVFLVRNCARATVCHFIPAGKSGAAAPA